LKDWRWHSKKPSHSPLNPPKGDLKKKDKEISNIECKISNIHQRIQQYGNKNNWIFDIGYLLLEIRRNKK
jgi:hypothetical protein